MENKTVGVGSTVTVEVYLGQKERKHLSYKRFTKGDNPNYLQTFIITKDDAILNGSNWGRYLHPKSFAGRALWERKVGDEVEVNVGGLSVQELRVGQTSSNHLKYKIVSIE